MPWLEPAPRFLLFNVPVWDVATPPYAPAYVSSIIRQAGWECRVADLNIALYHAADAEDRPQWQNLEFYRLPEPSQAAIFGKYRATLQDQLNRLLQPQGFDMFGFSVNLQSRYFAIWIAHMLSAMQPHIPVLFGGSECFPWEYGKRFLERGDYCPDLILQGEAEIALVRFLREFRRTRSCATGIPGFCYRRNGAVVDTGEPELPDLQEGTIADFSHFDFRQYQEPLQFSTFFTRGCVNHCAFCNERAHFKRFRIRPPQAVVREIRETLPRVADASAGLPLVRFNDSIFNGSPQAVERLCDRLLEAQFRLAWGVQVSFSRKLDKKLLEKMAAAGCRHFFWGFENASQRILDAMRKNYTLEEAEKILDSAATLGIQNNLPVIVGFPGETPQDILVNIQFILGHRRRPGLHFIYVSPVQLKAGSPLLEQHAAYGIQGLDNDHWYTADEKNIRGVRVFRTFLLLNVIHNIGLTPEEMVHPGYLQHMDFNQLSVASEIAWTLYLLGGETRREAQARELLEQWEGEELVLPAKADLACWRPAPIPADVRLTAWFTRDKNSAAAKQRLMGVLLGWIRELENLHSKD